MSPQGSANLTIAEENIEYKKVVEEEKIHLFSIFLSEKLNIWYVKPSFQFS